MFDLGYVKPEEVPQIPQLAKAPKAIVYSPLAEAPVDPDMVPFALPASLQFGAIASSGCIGNRVYSGLDKEEMYVALRGDGGNDCRTCRTPNLTEDNG